MPVAENKGPLGFIASLKQQGSTPPLYVIRSPKIRNCHVFRFSAASQKYQEIQNMTLAEFRVLFPNATTAQHRQGCLEDEEQLAQSVIGVADLDGYTTTTNREHAKIILREARQLDPSSHVHAASLPLDENEPIDFEKASWPACAQKDKEPAKENKKN